MAAQDSGGPATGRGRAKQDKNEDLSAQIDALKADLQSISATLRDLVMEEAGPRGEKLGAAAKDYIKHGREHADDVLAEARAARQDLEAKVVENPMAALLIAVGLGFLVGLLSRR